MSNADQAGSSEQAKGGGFSTPITILVLVLVWLATFFIPSDQYQLDATGSPIAGSFQNIPSPLDFEGRLRDLLLAPVTVSTASRIRRPGWSGRSTAASCSARYRCSCSSSPSAGS